MKQTSILKIILTCALFIISFVVLATMALFMYFESIFTTDIKILSLFAILSVLFFVIYIFVMRIIEFAKEHNQRETQKKSNAADRVSKNQQQENSENKEEPLQPAKVYKPVFGPSADNHYDDK